MAIRAAAILLLSLFARPALAQDVPPPEGAAPIEAAPEGTEADARTEYDLGEAAYVAGNFDEALQHFQRAYDLSGRSELLYNVGLAATNTGDERTALAAFERYVAELPDASNRALVEGRMAGLREEIEEEETIRRYAAAEREAQARERMAGVDAARTAGLGLTITGGVLAVAGGVLLALGYVDFFAVEGAAAGTTWAAVRDAQARAPILTGVGFGSAGVGLALLSVGLGLALGTPDPPPSADSVVVSIGPGSLLLRGSF